MKTLADFYGSKMCEFSKNELRFMSISEEKKKLQLIGQRRSENSLVAVQNSLTDVLSISIFIPMWNNHAVYNPIT